MMKLGCDVSNGFVVLYDGVKTWVFIDSQDPRAIEKAKRILRHSNAEHIPTIEDLKRLIQGKHIVAEVTGAYGVRYALLFQSLGATVSFVDPKSLSRERNRKKDVEDARLLYDYQGRTYQYEDLELELRHLVNAHRSLTAFTTAAFNRFKQALAGALFVEAYHTLPRRKFITANYKPTRTFLRVLRLLEDLHPINETHRHLIERAKYEGRHVLLILERLREVRRRIREILRQHPYTERLDRVPYTGFIQKATIIAYAWDIHRFASTDHFVSYMLVSLAHEESGQQERDRKDRKRVVVKAHLWHVYLQARKRRSRGGKEVRNPYWPVVEIYDTRISPEKKGRGKIIFTKFIDWWLRVVFYVLRDNVSFEEVVGQMLSGLLRDEERLIRAVATLLRRPNLYAGHVGGRRCRCAGCRLQKNEYQLQQVRRWIEAYREILQR